MGGGHAKIWRNKEEGTWLTERTGPGVCEKARVWWEVRGVLRHHSLVSHRKELVDHMEGNRSFWNHEQPSSRTCSCVPEPTLDPENVQGDPTQAQGRGKVRGK